MTVVIGGSYGADCCFLRNAVLHAFDVEISSFVGHRPLVILGTRVVVRTSTELDEANPFIAKATKLLRKKSPKSLAQILRCNWYIIKDAEVVYVVGRLRKNGNVEGIVKWSCAMVPMRVPLFFYDMRRKRWVCRTMSGWVSLSVLPTPRVFERIACIGSRKLSKEGRHSIESLFR